MKAKVPHCSADDTRTFAEPDMIQKKKKRKVRNNSIEDINNHDVSASGANNLPNKNLNDKSDLKSIYKDESVYKKKDKDKEQFSNEQYELCIDGQRTNNDDTDVHLTNDPQAYLSDEDNSKSIHKKKCKKRKPLPDDENEAYEKTSKLNGYAKQSIKGSTTEQNSEKQIENQSEERITQSQLNELSGMYFRNGFASSNGLDMLKKFVVVCKENKEKDLAAEYLLAGGSLLEILRLLDTSEKKNVVAINAVFSAIHILIMKILARYPQYQNTAIEACRHLINSHLSSIHSMLSAQSNTKQRKTVLKMLAAMVSLGDTIPRELLAHLSLQLETLDSLVRQTAPTDPQNVRTCFIHFVLAFLVEGNVPVIKVLLDKRTLLSSIFPSLIYDSHEIVNLVLTTVKSYILKNPGISKTAKLHLFSVPVVQNLICLYNWKGPNNWSQKSKRNPVSSDIRVEEKEIVCNVLHDFLITLLTSHRHGIIFHDHTLGTSRTRHNQLVYSVLQSLDRPWEHEKPSDLVVRITAACPDLIQSEYARVGVFLKPRASVKWISLMKFLGKIIESIDIYTCIKSCSSELNASQLANVLLSLLMPPTIMKNGIVVSLNDASVIVRHEGIILLAVILNQLKKLLSITNTDSFPTINSSLFRSCTADYIAKNLPNIDMILKVWASAFNSESNTDTLVETDSVAEPPKQDHLGAILDLLHAYRDVCPELMDSASNAHSNLLLTGLNDLHIEDNVSIKVLKVKAIQFLFSLDSTIFAPHKEEFGESLSFLLSVMDENSSTISLSAVTTIKMLLTASNLFEGCAEQIDIWINGFFSINSDQRSHVVSWFVSTVKSAANNIDKYINIIIQAEETVGEEKVCATRIQDLFNDLFEEDVSDNVADTHNLHMQSTTSISPLLSCAIRKTKHDSDPTIICYLCYVFMHTLHHQVVPGPFVFLTNDVPNLPIQKHLQSWLYDSHPIHMKKLFPSMNMMSKLSKALLTTQEIELQEIFAGDNTLTFSYKDKEITISHSLSAYDVTSLLRMIIFHLTHFCRQGTLEDVHVNNCTKLLGLLLHVAASIADANESVCFEECLRIIFTHPIMLQFFAPLCRKKDTIESMITGLILDVCSTTVRLSRKQDIKETFLPFKNKFLTRLRRMINKNLKSEKINTTDVIAFLRLLQLTAEDIVHLLNTLIGVENEMFLSKDKSHLSVYGYIIPSLLKMICSEEMSTRRIVFAAFDKHVTRQLFSYLIYLKGLDIDHLDDWETGIRMYLSNFPHNIAGIDTDAFAMFLQRKINVSTVELIAFFMSRSVKFLSSFIQHVTKLEDMDPNIIFPIMRGNLRYEWTRDYLSKLCQCCKERILHYLTDPRKSEAWIEGNSDVVIYLIEKMFDRETCKSICDKISQSGDKLDLVSVQYIKILERLYSKYGMLADKIEESTKDLIQILLYITTLTLKKESKNIEKLTILCQALNNTISNLTHNKKDFVFEKLHNHNSWPQFTRFALKLGLKISDGNTELPILKALNKMCDIAYRNDDNEEYVKTLFEMATAHSEFVNIMLGNTNVKRDLVELLWILTRKNRSVMMLEHVPLYLAAYNATLSEADQFLLLLLQLYESCNIKIDKYRPYLWGNTAAVHYSIKGETDTALWRQPTTSQVLNLLEREIVENTIKHYPVDRALENNVLHDSLHAYDPAFYLPLLCDLLSYNNVVACHKVTQSGALALLFSACASNHDNVRLAAFTAIARYYFHLEGLSSKEKLLWMRLVDALRHGIASTEIALKEIRLNGLVAIFLARTSLIATQPLHPLYCPLNSFLMAKPALNLTTIPEFLQLFHSSDIEHKVHRHWILEIIRDGINSETDVKVVLNCAMFKILLDFYTCTLSDDKTKELILEVILSTSRIPNAIRLIVREYGLLPWLVETVAHLGECGSNVVFIIVNIVHNIVAALRHQKEEDVHYKFMLLKTLLSLKPHLSKNIDITIFTLYVNVLEKLFSNESLRNAVSKQDVQDVLDVSKRFLNNVDDCEDILRYGCVYVQKIECASTEDSVQKARNSLQSFIRTWCGNKTR